MEGDVSEDITKSLEQIEQITNSSPEDIARNAIYSDETQESAQTEPEQPLVTENPQGLSPEKDLADIQKTEEEIAAAALENAKSPKSIASFDGLKARYANSLGSKKEVIASYVDATKQLEAEREQLRQEREAITNQKEYNTNLEDTLSQVNSLKSDLEAAQAELQAARYYVRKYDAEKDPLLKREYLDPMGVAENKAMKILEKSGLTKADWNTLIKSDEVTVNSLIDEAGITGLNATSLKNYVDGYQMLSSSYEDQISPEKIDSTINYMRGKSITLSDSVAKEVFDSVKTNFETNIDSLRKSDINKEHNLYVHDETIDQAQKNYASLRGALGPDYQNETVMAALAKTALMTAAYPNVEAYNKYLIATVEDMAKTIREGDSAPDIKQTTEQPQKNGVDLSAIETIQAKSPEDIAREAIFGEK